jgi:hypothetical protein
MRPRLDGAGDRLSDTPHVPTSGSSTPAREEGATEEPMDLDFDQLHAGGFRGEVGMFLVKDQAAKSQANSVAGSLHCPKWNFEPTAVHFFYEIVWQVGVGGCYASPWM